MASDRLDCSRTLSRRWASEWMSSRSKGGDEAQAQAPEVVARDRVSTIFDLEEAPRLRFDVR